MSEIIAEEIDASLARNICGLSGPNIAQEAAQGLHSLAVIAAEDIVKAEKAREIMNSNCFQFFTTTDIVGVELGGALKNVVALGIGILDGLDYGNNTKAALVTQGLAEIATLGTALGAKVITFYGLSCLGDIIATSFSPFSRNHRVGVGLAQGRSLEEITGSMPNVAEGVATTMAAWKLAQRLEIGTPMIEQLYKVLFQKLAPRQAISGLIKQLAEPEIKDESIRYFVLPAQPTR
jgi:glycerol-3-phosphate dehydrogenase (NAD(P)+)